jgi:diguanylate cyclase (GGDEF)-like protein/PAS domain S-box-containing protein
MPAEHTARLLIVDDDEMNRDMLSRRLELHGFSTCLASSGNEALDLVTRGGIDLVLLDVQMPGMSGLDVLRRLRVRLSSGELPIIMVTAKDRSEDIVEALSLGANDFIAKPLDLPVALARIRTQVERKSAEDRLRESEERYALAVAGANDGIWDWKLTSDDVYYSPRWKALLGLENEQVPHRVSAWFDRVHPDDVSRLRAEIDLHLRGQLPHLEVECRMRHASGGYRWTLTRGLAVRGPDGQPIRFAGSLTDITQGKVADVLTSLPNRVLFMDRLLRCVELSKRRPECRFAVLFIDLDGFKVVNDSLGHAIGDQLLVGVARRLELSVRSGDSVGRLVGDHDARTVARLGGDEFTILLPDVRQASDATRVADRIIDALKAPFAVGGREVYATPSIGIVVGGADYLDASDVLRDADIALYRAKSLGKARSVLFDVEMRRLVMARLELETGLRRAVPDGQLRLFYQPLIRLGDSAVAGVEALLRWEHPEHGLLTPDRFISIAEETGLIVPIGQWVMNEACQQLAEWRRHGVVPEGFSVSVNVSTREFQRESLVDDVRAMLGRHQLRGGRLDVEITESTAMENASAAIDLMAGLKAAGVSLALDDFGAGHSSLAHLHRFPIDRLKIDRSFVRRMRPSVGEEDSTPIVRTILALAEHMGIDVVAEGVEHADQRDTLDALGCLFGQGYLFSGPVSAAKAPLVLGPRVAASFGSVV